jgi:hypothetical protein
VSADKIKEEAEDKAVADAATRPPSPDPRLNGQYVPPLGERIEWPLHLFECLPGVDRGEAIDLTGQQKTLLFGPYVQLPAGLWLARMRFSIDPQGGEVQARFDWGALGLFTTETYLIRDPGQYEARMVHAWDSPQAAEFRAFTCRPSFQGYIRFHGFSVERLSDSSPPSTVCAQA